MKIFAKLQKRHESKLFYFNFERFPIQYHANSTLDEFKNLANTNSFVPAVDSL